MRTIAFLAGDQTFDGESVRRMPAGGIQHATASLAEAFARAGNHVSVYNGTPKRAEISGVHWMPLNSTRDIGTDLVLANNSARMFHSVASGTKVVWFHNPVGIRHHFKRGNLFPVLKHRPHAVFLGRYHEQSASRLLPFASRRIIGYANSPEFVRHHAAAAPPPPRAVFTSQAYRGLKWVLELWAKHVWPAVPNAEFHIFAQAKDVAVEDYRRFGVVPRERMPRAELVQELMDARLLFCPGHRDETYCFAAAEATLAGLPIVTRGIGALAERVEHGVNGYIAADPEPFARHAVMLLSEDDMWLQTHRGALARRDLSTWDDRVAQWTEAFLR
jgi:glycosyltransferase involved in cell wall biosynthesis